MEEKKEKRKIKTPATQPQQSRQTNMADVLINLTNKTYDIINSGNILGVIAVIILLTLWKLPPENINTHLSNIIAFFTREKFYVVPIGGVTFFSVYVNFYQRKTYRDEIKRLVELRRILMHGKEKEELKELDEHASSKYDPAKDL